MIVFSSFIKSEIFPTEWEIGNVVPMHKRDYKLNVKNYRPVLLLPIFGKIFERFTYNKIYSSSVESNLISLNQSGFKEGILVLITFLNTSTQYSLIFR